MTSNNEPKLARPGAGMPIPQRWVARFVIPYRAKQSNWDENIARFQRHSKAIEELAKSLTTEQLNTRFLVNPIVGLEDSSRYWSPAMVLDHLMIVGTGLHQIVQYLSRSQLPPIEVRIENVKPPAKEHDLGIVQKFHLFWDQFVPTLKLGSDLYRTKVKHPWFGPLNAHQWIFVLSLHHGVHLQQFRQIVESFKIRT